MADGIYSSMCELQAINYVYAKNSLQLFILNNIDETYFTTYKDHYRFITAYFDKYNQLPSKETFQSKFHDNFDWIYVTDPENSIIDRLREAKLFRDLIGDYKKMGELIKSEKSDEAVALMASLSQQYLKQNQSKCVDLIDDVKIRYDSYIERVNNPDRYFVSTGLKELDKIIGGWDREEESAVICARTGYGKSWWLIYFALQAARAGLRVGYYSGEMAENLVGYRLDTFMGNISNGSLTHGNGNVRDDYETYVENLSSVVPGHVYCITPEQLDGSATVSKMRAFIEKYDLQMLCVDQFSLLDDQKRAKTPREQAINISKDLRLLQKLKKIPILAAVQLNREESENGPSTRNIAESDRIGQDSTTVLFIERKNNNVILTVGKARNANTGEKLTYAWNINTGVLNYIPADTDAIHGESDVDADYDDSDKSNSVF